MKKIYLLLALVLCSCKSIYYEDVNPDINPNHSLLPALNTVIDISNMEGTYSSGGFFGEGFSNGAGFGDGWLQTSTISGRNYKDSRVKNAISLFEKEVKENITNPYGIKKGYIALKLGYRGQDESFFYPFCSILSLGTLNIFGFPASKISQFQEIEVEIWNNNKELVKRYVVNSIDTNYIAMYWGYNGNTIGEKLAADNIKHALAQIRQQINRDARYINMQLR